MRRLNYQTPGKEQLILLNPASSGSPYPCPHARGRVRQSGSPSHPPGDPHFLSHSDTEWALDQGCPGIYSGLQILLSLQACEAGEPEWDWPVLCGVCQIRCEAHYSCPELGGASMQLGVSTPGMFPGAELASPWLSFSAEHNWCSVGHMGCIWGSQKVHRALLHC